MLHFPNYYYILLVIRKINYFCVTKPKLSLCVLSRHIVITRNIQLSLTMTLHLLGHKMFPICLHITLVYFSNVLFSSLVHSSDNRTNGFKRAGHKLCTAAESCWLMICPKVCKISRNLDEAFIRRSLVYLRCRRCTNTATTML